jgi:hypothetical protein
LFLGVGTKEWVMGGRVSGLLHHLKVVDAVVELVAVLMVNNLIGSKRASKVLLNQVPMIQFQLSDDADHVVPGSVNKAALITGVCLSSMALAIAGTAAILQLLGLARYRKATSDAGAFHCSPLQSSSVPLAVRPSIQYTPDVQGFQRNERALMAQAFDEAGRQRRRDGS